MILFNKEVKTIEYDNNYVKIDNNIIPVKLSKNNAKIIVDWLTRVKLMEQSTLMDEDEDILPW